MSVQQIIKHEMVDRPTTAGIPYFCSLQFKIEWQGSNSLGNHDTTATVHIYEPLTQDNKADYDFDELKYLVYSQLTAYNVPDLLVNPDFYHNLDENNTGNITHHAYVWEENIKQIDIDLSPYYFVKKFIYMRERFVAFPKMHNLYLLVETIDKKDSNKQT